MWRFFIYSLIGIIFFFVPVTIQVQSTIMIDHIVQWITLIVNPVLPYYVLILYIIFSLFKVVGVFIAFMVVFNIGPAFVLKESIGPFLYEKLAIPLSVLIPIGAIFLSFLVGFGLLEFIGVICRPIMRPIFKTPG